MISNLKIIELKFNGLGSIVAIIGSDPNEPIVESYSYDAFGAVLIYDPNGIPLSQSAIDNPYLFTARRYDSESGLYYYRFRMYDAELGRFLQTDPIGYYDSMNLYQYCMNNPVNYIDPFGETLLKPIRDVPDYQEKNNQRLDDIMSGKFMPKTSGDWAPGFSEAAPVCLKQGLATPGLSMNIPPTEPKSLIRFLIDLIYDFIPGKEPPETPVKQRSIPSIPRD